MYVCVCLHACGFQGDKHLLKTHLFVLHISVIRHENYYFLLDYLVILSVQNYTLNYWHYCYVIIIIIIF